MSVSLIIPAFNEAESIGQLLAETNFDQAQQVIVVDNGSIDQTAEIALAAGAKVVQEPRPGYGSGGNRSSRDHPGACLQFTDLVPPAGAVSALLRAPGQPLAGRGEYLPPAAGSRPRWDGCDRRAGHRRTGCRKKRRRPG